VHKKKHIVKIYDCLSVKGKISFFS